MTETVRKARELLSTLTPLTSDCGQVCGGRCCRASAQSIGMLLFPGEETLLPADGFTVRDTPGGKLVVCDSTCRRDNRPLTCRLFPLFPVMGVDGRVRVIYDPRGWRLCPLVRQCEHVPFSRDFVHAVRCAGRLLFDDPDIAPFMKQQQEEIEDLGRLLPLSDCRPPIMRRKIR